METGRVIAGPLLVAILHWFVDCSEYLLDFRELFCVGNDFWQCMAVFSVLFEASGEDVFSVPLEGEKD